MPRQKLAKVWFAFVVFAVGAVIGIWITASLLKAHEPVYKGKGVGAWIAQMYSNPNDVTARDELVKMGIPAIPYLILEVRKDGGAMASFHRWLWWKMPSGIQRHLAAPPNYFARRCAAADALNGFGPAASNAVPALIGCLQCAGYQPLRFSATVALGRIGAQARDAVPALAQALKDQDFNVRMEAALALAKIGQGYPQAAPQLEELLRDRVPGVRLRAALALWRLQPGETTASNRIAHILFGDPDPALRGWAATLIGDLGPAAAGLSPLLQDALRDPDSQVRQDAKDALKKLNASVPMDQDNREN